VLASPNTATYPNTADGFKDFLLSEGRQARETRKALTAAAAQSDSSAFAKFKSEMMPKVGQKITVVGTLYDGKQGFWLAFNHWGAYIYPAKKSGVAKQSDLYAHFRRGQNVKVTGTLRHFAGPAATREDEQHAPEHFFFDTGEVEMVPLVPTALKNPNKVRQ
jgi:hypothetical protein